MLISATVVVLVSYQLYIVVHYRRGSLKALCKNVVFQCLVILLIAYVGMLEREKDDTSRDSEQRYQRRPLDEEGEEQEK